MEEYEYLLENLNKDKGFLKALGIEFLQLEKGYAKAQVELAEQIMNPFGAVHGGCLFAISDSVAGTLAMTQGNYVTTTSGDIHYLNPAMNTKKMLIEAKELKAGKTMLTYEVTIYSEEGSILCKATLEYFSLGKIEKRT